MGSTSSPEEVHELVLEDVVARFSNYSPRNARTPRSHVALVRSFGTLSRASFRLSPMSTLPRFKSSGRQFRLLSLLEAL